jgi:uncharacterized membrane protein
MDDYDVEADVCFLFGLWYGELRHGTAWHVQHKIRRQGNKKKVKRCILGIFPLGVLWMRGRGGGRELLLMMWDRSLVGWALGTDFSVGFFFFFGRGSS